MTTARFVSISRGAEIEIDLSDANSPLPAFAYVDDVGAEVLPRYGLRLEGRAVIHDQPQFMWLDGPRDCARLVVEPEALRDGLAALRSLGVGEFCLELYLLPHDGPPRRICHGDFCFK
jgi:hypothetical protein